MCKPPKRQIKHPGLLSSWTLGITGFPKPIRPCTEEINTWYNSLALAEIVSPISSSKRKEAITFLLLTPHQKLTLRASHRSWCNTQVFSVQNCSLSPKVTCGDFQWCLRSSFRRISLEFTRYSWSGTNSFCTVCSLYGNIFKFLHQNLL